MGEVVKIGNWQRTLASMFPRFFGTGSTKHDHYKDFGFPADLTFDALYKAYLRNGIARAAVQKTIDKTWQENPYLLEKERDGSEKGTARETPLEKDIRERFDALRVWQHLAEADARSMVGRYSAVILRLADGKLFSEAVDTVPGGLDGLVEIIPVWEGQLTVSGWDSDERSETYGEPTVFSFNEANVETGKANHRAFNVHPSRVVVWSRTGTVHGSSVLEPGYNDLLTIEKIVGAGGEGFWKNAKSAPVLEVDKEANISAMAQAMGVQPNEIADKVSDQVKSWQQGFDDLLMLQGIAAKTLNVTLPSPEHFFAIALQSFAASVSIPLKILVGNQTGERASTEDASDWAQTNNSRRANIVVPNILMLARRLVEFRILPDGKDWFVDWTDLTEATMDAKIERASKMADVNQKTGTGEWVFTPEEIRAAVDYEPLSPEDAIRDDTSEEDENAALGLPRPGDEPAEDDQ